MKKINISKQITKENNNVRAARNLYTIRLFEQNMVFSFKNKKTYAAFVRDLQNEIEMFLISTNQIVADLYFIYRQNWQVCKDRNIPGNFLNIDTLLSRLTASDHDADTFYVVSDLIKLTNNIYLIINSLKKSAMESKNYTLNKYLLVFEFRIDALGKQLFSFGETGKWAAYGEKYNTKKLY